MLKMEDGYHTPPPKRARQEHSVPDLIDRHDRLFVSVKNLLNHLGVSPDSEKFALLNHFEQTSWENDYSGGNKNHINELYRHVIFLDKWLSLLTARGIDAPLPFSDYEMEVNFPSRNHLTKDFMIMIADRYSNLMRIINLSTKYIDIPEDKKQAIRFLEDKMFTKDMVELLFTATDNVFDRAYHFRHYLVALKFYQSKVLRLVNDFLTEGLELQHFA